MKVFPWFCSSLILCFRMFSPRRLRSLVYYVRSSGDDWIQMRPSSLTPCAQDSTFHRRCRRRRITAGQQRNTTSRKIHPMMRVVYCFHSPHSNRLSLRVLLNPSELFCQITQVPRSPVHLLILVGPSLSWTQGAPLCPPC